MSPASKVAKSQCFYVLPACVGLALVVATVSANAAPNNRAPASEKPAASRAEPSAPLVTVISIDSQRLTIWSGDTVVARASVSTGMAGHRTPTGVFSVIGKERYHESNLYSNAPMPFMQRITWSGVAMHAGALPGYPASHGCIRLSDDFAQRFFGMSRMGMRVIVSDKDVAPTTVAHPMLPSPTFVRATQMAANGPYAVTLAAPSGAMRLGAIPVAEERLLNPMERGKLEQGRAKMAALEAQADAQALLDIAASRGADARAADEDVRRAAAALAAINSGLEHASVAAADVTASPEDQARAAAARQSLDAAYRVAVQRLAAARAVASHSDAAAFAAAAEAKAAVAERDIMEQAARVAERATEPVSVFVSRKEHRVYVRQGFEPVFEADVDIADAETPLGTHVFTAIAPPEEGGASLRWIATTMPTAARADGAKATRGSTTTGDGRQPTAAQALSRIKFSDAVLQKVSEKVWTGASLIISDYGLSSETGKGTDFVLLTR